MSEHAVTYDTPIVLQAPAPRVAVLIGGPCAERAWNGPALGWVEAAVRLVENLSDPEAVGGAVGRESIRLILVTPGYEAWGEGALDEARHQLSSTGAALVEVGAVGELAAALNGPDGWIRAFYYLGHATAWTWRRSLREHRPHLLFSSGFERGNLALAAEAIAQEIPAAAFSPEAEHHLFASMSAIGPGTTDVGSLARRWAEHVNAARVWAAEELCWPRGATYAAPTRENQGKVGGQPIPERFDGLPYLYRAHLIVRQEDGRYRGHVASDRELSKTLKARYGLRPRRYLGAFNGNNEAERRFCPTLFEAVGWLNGRLAGRGSTMRVDAAELATNVLTEGGILAINDNLTENLDGFTYFGIDTLGDRLAALRPYLHQTVLDHVEQGNTAQYTNERGEQVTSAYGLTIEQGIWANTGMYVWHKLQIHDHIAAQGGDLAAAPGNVQAFWGTVAYNAGPGVARRFFDQHGLEHWRTRWTGTDDHHAHSRSARFNALWRTATCELLFERCFHYLIVDADTLRRPEDA